MDAITNDDIVKIRKEITTMTTTLLFASLLHPMYMLFDSAAIAKNGPVQIAGFGLGTTTVSIFAFAIGG